ncbi:MAG: MOSC domain-containing protein [Alphaproteobacteria bacterium]|nr:MOSC domain-containing protein [Alphaproteobacteria bacterium]
MQEIGRVAEVWRYPVKSMAGEAVKAGFLGFAGVYGDRVYAFRKQGGHTGFPFMTAREQTAMLLMRPRFRDPVAMAAPADLAAAASLGPGITPLYAPEAPEGETLAIDSPALAARVGAALLPRSERGLTDCRPLSLISLATIAQLAAETGRALDARRFRANLYLDLAGGGFAEDALIGRRIRLGDKAEAMLLEADPRCKMITLDPDTAEADPAILRQVAKAHGGNAGVYAAVLVEGMVRPGDPVILL